MKTKRLIFSNIYKVRIPFYENVEIIGKIYRITSKFLWFKYKTSYEIKVDSPLDFGFITSNIEIGVQREKIFNRLKLLVDNISKMTTYTVVTWPEVQLLMDLEGFKEHSYLINDEQGLNDFGSSAYFVETEWLSKNQ